MVNKSFVVSSTSVIGAKSVAFAVLLCFATSLPASANDRVTFREFRQQNEGLDRNLARQMFRQQYGRQNSHSSGNLNSTLTVPVLPKIRTVVDTTRGGAASFEGLRNGRELRVRNPSMQQLTAGGVTRVNRGIELDLSSATRNIVLGKGLFGSGQTVEVNIGGQTKTFSAGSQVTAAEYVAVKQVLDGGEQQVLIDRAGRASGGSVDLGALTARNDVMRASSLVVPEDVTTYGDFGRGSDFRLTGDLSNFGTIQTLSSRDDIRGGSLRANNISNHKGASIHGSGDLRLAADSNLSNYGDISSTGNLSLIAGGKLLNTGKVSADGELAIDSAHVNNRGILSSTSSNVMFNSGASADLVVDNRKGTVTALNGAINLRDAAYGGAADSSIVGGDLFSNALNLNSGFGTSYVNVNELTGVVNETGSAAHVWASTDTLVIGDVCLTGDPTYFNVSGNIDITGNIVVAEDLTIVAGRNIVAQDNATITAGDATRGYNITMIAGASFTSSGGGPISVLNPGTSPTYSGTVTISGKGSKTGGSISFGENSKISSRSTDLLSPGDRDGGNIEFFLFGKKEGYINLSGVALESGGVNLGDNGNLVIVNEHAFKGYTNPTITVGNIDTTNQTGGTQGSGGSIVISGTKPVIVDGSQVVYGPDGVRVGAAHFEAGTKLVKGSGAQLYKYNSDDDSPVMKAASDISIAADLFYTGGDIFGKNVFVSTTVGMYTGENQVDPTLPFTIYGAESVSLQTAKGGVIGGSTYVPIVTPVLQVANPGGYSSIYLRNTGDVDVSINSKVVYLYADQADLFGNVTNAEEFHVVGGALNMDPITTSSVIDLTSLTAPLVDDGTNYISPTLILGGPNVGTVLNPFLVNAATKQVSVFADDAFVSYLGTKKPIKLGESVGGSLFFDSLVGMTVVGPLFATDSLTVQAPAGTIRVDSGVQVGAINSVSIVNSGTTKKDKIAIGKGAIIGSGPATVGTANILIRLGSASATIAPVPANVSTTGNVQILGLGLTAKSPVNVVTANGTSVILSNNTALKNFVLEGNVGIIALP